MSASYQQRLAEHYAELSPRLREAGDYLVENPLDVATRSLRSVATEARIAPATFSRLARALGFETFETLRDAVRAQLALKVSTFATRAKDLREAPAGAPEGILMRSLERTQSNLEELVRGLDPVELAKLVDVLHEARRVLIVGALGSTGIAEYAGYMANFLGEKWRLAGRMGSSYGSALSEMDKQDAVIVITMSPSARVAVNAAEIARHQGVHVAVITDSYASPALRHANSSFIITGESPNFFNTYTTTVFFLEILMAMLAQKAGPDVVERISEIERHNRALGEVVDL
ncbi:MurR/RpiR family transcriptional regulator [Celeribacter halophilus]|uniref:MurR/RpiR family transcriptional regulator n=1 Tax=Celeribacter halophilus TaxID=576117 RepID=UPI0026E2AF7A|nr:MurR/RpiR family transcriptional regulator [Celeribacter halophilus]MDO6724345.1 MurR/RpiR family transcriptional regulator [Celeribacter halophilus]